MIGLDLPPMVEAVTALLIVAVMFIAFMREVYPVEVVAISGAAVMLMLGILPYGMALEVFSNHAPWTIAALFVIVGALVRTGTLDWITQIAARHVKQHPVLTLGMLTLTALFLSAFVNNTPIVVVMIPIFIQLARQMQTSASKLLIPLSYFSIFGGTITLVGTSTNLLVDGVAQNAGLAPFTIFEITLAGLVMALVGVTYLATIGRFLLPNRDSLSTLLSDRSKMKFFTEVVIPENSSLIGRPIDTIDLFKREGARVIDVLRGDASLRRDIGAVELAAGDRVVLRTAMSEVLGLKKNKDVATPKDAEDPRATERSPDAPAPETIQKLSSVRTSTVEALIAPGCRMVGRTLGSLRLRRRYGVYPLAVHRRNQNIGRNLDELVVRVGDTLLLEGTPADIQRLATDMDMVDIAQPSDRAYRRSHAPIVIATLAAIVALSALGVAPILLLAVIGVAVVLLTRCIDADEAFGFIDGRLLALIFGMLAVGAGLQDSGAVALIVSAAVPLLGVMPPVLLVLSVYVLTSVLTELVTNNAVAVVMTPIVISLGLALGVDPRPLVVAVMLAASASFATPIGYQTNTLVYGPGGYRFTDFMKVGIPLNILMALTASLVIPWIWPL
ncbi:SLC13 family permease [Rhodobacteraceae bacterium 2376]|uniref:SLC13 family permease n=1 Tax=Rhabdonatronobacter sediminivivens TaxID=2743469 RepID=A0A7Z0HXS6_9RHOB|nr:SLC13 family permease [Rhabdonatronobacter sediminivivens]NYS24258.1 SLC13 family permease [Rhabdonatronobacter sediminivivens]